MVFSWVPTECNIEIDGEKVKNIGRTDRDCDNWCRMFRPCRPLSTACKTFVHSWQRPTRPKHPASVVIDSATHLLMISSPNINNVAMSLYNIKVKNVKETVYLGVKLSEMGRWGVRWKGELEWQCKQWGQWRCKSAEKSAEKQKWLCLKRWQSQH